jgi:hypothetical protein
MIVCECTKGNCCRDNVTLIIVSLREYYQDFRQNHHRRYPTPYSDCSSCSLNLKKEYSDNLIINSQQSFSSESSPEILKQIDSVQSFDHLSNGSNLSLSSEKLITLPVKRVKISATFYADS